MSISLKKHFHSLQSLGNFHKKGKVFAAAIAQGGVEAKAFFFRGWKLRSGISRGLY